MDSIPLITASILAKKLAEGLDALVMDVKVAARLCRPTNSLKPLPKRLLAWLTALASRTCAAASMNQVLSSAGNAVEVREAVQFLTG